MHISTVKSVRIAIVRVAKIAPQETTRLRRKPAPANASLLRNWDAGVRRWFTVRRPLGATPLDRELCLGRVALLFGRALRRDNGLMSEQGGGGTEIRKMRRLWCTLRPMAFTIEREELERLADLAEALVINCHSAEREANPSQWDEVLQSVDDVAAYLLRRRVMQGDLKTVARQLIRPQTRSACAMTFLAEVERYLDLDDVRELRELWKQPAHDKTATLGRVLAEQQRIDRANQS